MRYLPLLAVAASLAACSTQRPQVVGDPPPGIAFRLTDGDQSGIDQKAQEYCAQYGKQAKRQSIDPAAKGAPIAQYTCS